jgi:hypothetical protein
MKTFLIQIKDSPELNFTVTSKYIDDAYFEVRGKIKNVQWDMCPIFCGEKRADTYYKVNGKKIEVILTLLDGGN